MTADNSRWAGRADADAILALVQSAYRGDASRRGWTTEADFLDGTRIDRDHLLALMPAADSSGGDRFQQGILLIEDAEGLVGCAHLHATGGRVWFGLFAVDPARQGQGMGGRLLQAAEARAREDLQASALALQVIWLRDSLIAWYQRRGYAVTGEQMPFPYGDERFGIPLRDDLHFIILEKPLQ